MSGPTGVPGIFLAGRPFLTVAFSVEELSSLISGRQCLEVVPSTTLDYLPIISLNGKSACISNTILHVDTDTTKLNPASP